MRLRGKLRATRAALRRLDETLARGEIHQSTYDRLRAELGGREGELESEMESLAPSAEAIEEAELRRTAEQLLDCERESVQEAAKAGVVSDAVARELLEEITQRAIAVRRPELVDAKPAPSPPRDED
jgi:hypothetical protein